MNFSIFKTAFFIKLFNWEYWPTPVVYGPIFPVYLWYCLKARSFFFFSTSNPTIKNAGLLMESKYEIDSIIPPQFRPASIYFEPGTDFDIIIKQVSASYFTYPLIIKPDIGGKGVGVKKINNAAELEIAVKLFPVAFIIQPFVCLPNEIGLFYVRLPGQEKGNITGIVRKDFLKIRGDGIHSIIELLEMNARHILQIPALKAALKQAINKVVPAGVTEILVPYGNHARGSLFLDHSHLITPQLIESFNRICSQIDGFYFGRMDIRYNTWEELEKGLNLSIIELNGAGSEPTHIYDPGHSIFFAWKEIIRHWKLLWQVSKKSKQQHKLNYMDLKDGLRMLSENKAYNKKASLALAGI